MRYAFLGNYGAVAELNFLLVFHHMHLNHKGAAAVGADRRRNWKARDIAAADVAEELHKLAVEVMHHNWAAAGMKGC
jgi:hypothetical protein